MFSQKQLNEALARREERIIQHIKDGLTSAEVAHLEGLEPDFAHKEQLRIAKKHDLKRWTKPRLPPAQREKVLPYGLTEASAPMRRRLKSKLADRKEHPVDLAGTLGLTQTQQRLSQANPSNCDWKISQLERLAALEGKTFREFMLELFL